MPIQAEDLESFATRSRSLLAQWELIVMIIEPERHDYGWPVGVLWQATFTIGNIKHNIASPTKDGAKKLIERLLDGDLPGNV